MQRQVEGTEKVIARMGHWAPSDLAYIEQLELHAGLGEPASLNLVALFQQRSNAPWPDVRTAMHRVTLRFDGVNNLHLKGFGGGGVQVSGFAIHPIADHGWEDALFAIEDYEAGVIGFTCNRAQIVNVEEEEVWLG